MKIFLEKKPIKYFLILLFGFMLSCCNSCEKSSDDYTPKPEVTIESTTFKNPIRNSAADPWVFKNGNEYFLTYTTGGNITLLRTEKMSDVKGAVSKIVWTPPSSGMNSKEIWAPELHKINGSWYVYYAASDGDNFNHKMWVLENTSEDPFQGEWIDKGELILPDNKWAIDGSPFEIDGEYYFTWSGWEGETNIRQNIYLAKMQDPLTVTGERFCLLKPEKNWEKNGTSPQVTEGPQFFERGNKLFIFYSAGGCWKDGYSIGLIWIDKSNDITNPELWQRYTDDALFASNTVGNAFAPGHNSFFKSLNNDEDWILYHANSQSGQGCGSNRSMRMQKIQWNSEGFPILGIPEPLNSELTKPSGE